MKYLDDKGREVLISTGISRPPNETWGVYRRKPSGSLQRIKSFPTRGSREEAERDLAKLARKKGWKRSA